MIVTIKGRRFLIHDREEWQNPAQPVTGPKPSPELVHHAVIHWPGSPDNWVPDADVAAHLRAAHASYLRNKGFSYGYGFVCGPNPVDWNADPIVTDIWEVRGTDIRLASNDGDNGVYGTYSNPNFNGRSNSLQIMASTKCPATDDQIEQARYWVAWMDDVYGETLTVIPHCTSDATSCPGDYLESKIDHIATRPPMYVPPTVPDDLPPEEDSTMSKIYLARLQDDPATGANEGYHLRRGDGNVATVIRSREYAYLKYLFDNGMAVPAYYEPGPAGKLITSWGEIPVVETDTELDLWVGYVDGASLADEG